jgi:uncharacterized protein YmfQ (DUF2313 family)
MGAPNPPTALHWAEALRRLLPPSVVGLYRRGWAVLDALLSALGAELARVDQRGLDILDEYYPSTASETIARWETMLGLVADPGDTLAERQARCAAKFRSFGGSSPAYLVGVCEAFGYAPGTVTLTEPASGYPAFRTGLGRCGDPIGGGYAQPHSFLIEYPAPTNAALEALISEIKPAHTWVYFATV